MCVSVIGGSLCGQLSSLGESVFDILEKNHSGVRNEERLDITTVLLGVQCPLQKLPEVGKLGRPER